MNTTEKLDKLYEEKQKLEREIYESETHFKKELLEKKSLVDGFLEYMRFKGYPDEVYSEFGIDSGIRDSFGKVQIKVVYNYGYTDIVGLSDEEWKLFVEKINKRYEQLGRRSFLDD